MIGLAVLLIIAGSARHAMAFAASSQDALDFAGADFAILTPDGGRVIGHAHYAVERQAHDDLLRGENRYLDGQYDVELDKIEAAAPGAAPTLVSYEHSFFDPSGAPLRIVRADLRGGDASCTQYQRGQPETIFGKLDFPPDTYAGASLLIPIEYRLRVASEDSIRLHAFSCVPGPRVLAVELRPRSGLRWPGYAGDVLGVDLRPKLGWWDLLIAPFIPKVRAWFDPAHNFDYVGGDIQRFYRGPWVELLRESDAPVGEAQRTPPPERHD